MKDLILKYFNAFSNLYGIIPMRKAYRIIEKQNPELELTKERFVEIVENIDHKGKYYDILSEEEIYDEDANACPVLEKILIADYVMTFGDPNDYDTLVIEQDDRLFYVPEKEELLKYEDDTYYEKTKHNINLENFLRDEFGIPNYEEIVDDFVGMLIIDDYEPDSVIKDLKRMGRPYFKEFTNKEQAHKFAQLYINLRNHTRKHTHRGHTPFELDDCYEIDYMLEYEKTIEVKIPSKNGKCPCGSGKKFKRCCMGKGIYD